MSVRITNRKYQNKYYPDGNTTDWLIGNVGDLINLQFDAFVKIDFVASQKESFSHNENQKTLELNNGRKWSDYGFDVGMVVDFKFTQIITRRTLAESGATGFEDARLRQFIEVEFTIVNLYGSFLEYEVVPNSSIVDDGDFDIDWLAGNEFLDPIPDGMGFLKFENVPTDRGQERIYDVFMSVSDEPQGVRLQYAHTSNEEIGANSLNSFIDGTTPQFTYVGFADAAILGFRDMMATGFQSGMGIVAAKVSESGADSDGFYKYTFDVDFYISSFFDSEESIIDFEQPPVVFDKNAIADNFKLEFLPKWNNPNSSIQSILRHTERLGNTGWFNENFNGLENKYKVESVSYTDEAGNAIRAIDYSKPTNVTVKVSGFTTGEVGNLGAGFIWVPIDQSDYYTKRTPNHVNLFMNPAVSLDRNQNYNGTILDGFAPVDNADIGLTAIASNILSVSGNEAEFKLKYVPKPGFTEFFEARSESDRNYLLWVSVSDDENRVNFSNRVSLYVDYSEMVKNRLPDGELQGMSVKFLEHHQAEDATGVDSYKGFIEDDVLSRINFTINQIEPTTITSMVFGYEVNDNTTGLVFRLGETPVNFSSIPLINGVQPIEYRSTRGYKLPEGNNKNWLQVLRNESADSGTEKAYIAYFAQKIRWEDWLLRQDVPDAYYNRELLNTGFHNDWIAYQRASGTHEISMFVETNLIVGGESKLYKNSYPIELFDYEENIDITTQHNYYRNSDDTLLNSGVDTETGNNRGVLLSDEITRLEIIYTNSKADFDITKVYATHTIEVFRGAGVLEHRQLSSVWDSEADNPLRPLEGETRLKIELVSPRVIKTTSLIDPQYLEDVEQYKITGRLGCFPEGNGTTDPNPKGGLYEARYEPTYE